MVVNGCYVEVPWNDKFVPKTTFTVEAWVRVDWTANDPHAWRFVLDMREYSPVTTGNVFKDFGDFGELNSGDAVVRYDQLADRWLIVMPMFRRLPFPKNEPPGKSGGPVLQTEAWTRPSASIAASMK